MIGSFGPLATSLSAASLVLVKRMTSGVTLSLLLPACCTGASVVGLSSASRPKRKPPRAVMDSACPTSAPAALFSVPLKVVTIAGWLCV